MEMLFIPIVVLIGSILTFFSGFGLGTILLPAFSLFFPIEVAVLSTAIVHFFNSVFKVFFIFKNINLSLLLQFAITAIPFAIIGAWLFSSINRHNYTLNLNLGFYSNNVTILNFIIGIIMIFFAFIELFFKQTKLTVSKSSLLLGGAISGFFGGISGHQGAFRSMFLSKADVTKEEFVATSSSIGLLIDLTRIGIYVNGVNLFLELNDSLKWVLTISILIAFLGSYLGSKCLSKTTMKTVQIIVAISLMVVGGLLVIGIL